MVQTRSMTRAQQAVAARCGGRDTPQYKNYEAFKNARISKEFRYPRTCRKRAPLGLRNPKAVSCYRRSIMQMLLNTPLFLNWLWKHHSGSRAAKKLSCPESPCLACYFYRVAEAYWAADEKSARWTMAELDRRVHLFDINYVEKEWPAVSGHDVTDIKTEQQDADEFLQFLLSQLVCGTGPGARMGGPMGNALHEALFMLRTQHGWTCPQCGEHSAPRDSSAYTRTVYTAEHVGDSVQEHLDRSFEPETVDVKCARCDQLVRPQRAETIVASPELLLVQVSSFDVSMSKVEPVLDLSETLDLTQWVAPLQNTAAAAGPLQYVLRHVVLHVGEEPGFGHYFGRYSTPAGEYLLEDELVMPGRSVLRYGDLDPPEDADLPTAVAEMRREEDERLAEGTPYILMYERVGDYP